MVTARRIPGLSPLRLKLFRDLWHLRAQAVAIALVMAAGVATLVLGRGAVDALTTTRDAYYASHRFADVFAHVTRAPTTLGRRIAELDGVLAVDMRIVQRGILDIAGMQEPGTVVLVSLPPEGDGVLNRLYLRSGRLPDAGAPDEAAISENFARAQHLSEGSTFDVLMKGQRRTLKVVGIALSPEYIYAIGPGEMVPDDRRFGIVWMPEDSLATAYDLRDAFSQVSLKIVPGVSEDRVISELDQLLAPYGGTGATGRQDQVSHAFLDAELTQLGGMSRVLPPIFLSVAAFLVNMTLSRIVALEREQIGLLKALGYGSGAIARHYVEMVLVIAGVGILIGWGLGAWLGAGLARLYARFFNFPFLVFSRDPQVYAVAAIVTMAAAAAGAWLAVRSVVRLPPAVCMSPPAPARYRRLSWEAPAVARRMATAAMMVVRHLLHRPLRTVWSTVGVALAVGVLVGSLWSYDSVEKMIELTFQRASREDATIGFNETRPYAALYSVGRLPGVLRAEPFRVANVRISHGSRSRRIGLAGLDPDGDLSRILATDEHPMTLPDHGVVLSDALADLLDAWPGDSVRIDVLDGDRRSFEMPVAALSLGYFGLTATMRRDLLNRALGEGDVLSGAYVTLDPAATAEFHDAVKKTPAIGSVTLNSLAVAKFRETLAQNLLTMITVYTSLAAIIAFGVVYNFARVSLSEQGRELASLRVLGFGKGEVAGILYRELAAIFVAAQPLGWLIGYGFAVAMSSAFASELYRVPLVVTRQVYAEASLVVLAATALSALAVRGRIDRLDMIAVLKTRE